MKYLKINNNQGFYLKEDGEWVEIDKIDKNNLLYLLDKAVEENDFEIDDFVEESIRNKAHQIIYKNIFEKFTALIENKTRFRDESRKMYKDAFEKYSQEEEN